MQIKIEAMIKWTFFEDNAIQQTDFKKFKQVNVSRRNKSFMRTTSAITKITKTSFYRDPRSLI